MKGLSIFKKILFVGNVIVSFLLLLACIARYVSLEHFPYVAFIAIATPLLVIGNLLCFLYWIVLKKKQFLLSLLALVISYFSLDTFFIVKSTEDLSLNEDLSILTFNVHRFRSKQEILDLIDKQKADIICLQEYKHDNSIRFKGHPFKYINIEYYNRKGYKVQQAIFSKHEIIDKGSLSFSNSRNNAIFADIVFKNDTIRVYNIHLQSLQVRAGSIKREEPQKLYGRLSNKFIKQQEQADLIASHSARSPYKNIICGDFNNSQYSSVFHTIKRDMKDTFQEKGTGYGRTYDFKFLPLRIDFILADETFEVTSHKNFDQRLSDHYPVMASFRLKE